MTSYRWHRLSQPNMIRLLTLESGERENELRGRLDSATIRFAPAYEALSYAWEGSETPYNLATSDGIIPIPCCVWRALLDLRDNNQRRTLWIDSVCIDQADRTEKAQQVLLMKDIFACAQRVLIYMGPQTPHTLLGLWLLNTVLNVLQPFSKNARVRMSERDLLTLGLPPANDISWISLLSLAQHPWFRRIWTTQEFVVSKEARFVIGRMAFAPDFLLRALSMAVTTCMPQRASRLFARPRHLTFVMGLSNYILPLFKLQQKYRNGEREKVFELLRLHRHKEATEVRDKLFVLRNMARDGDHPSLLPDYECDLADIFTRYATYILRNDPTLFLLHEAGISNQRDVSCSNHLNFLPSWVPDWNDEIFIPFPFKPDPECLKGLAQKEIDIEERLMRVKTRLLDRTNSIIAHRSSFQNLDSFAISTVGANIYLGQLAQFERSQLADLPTSHWWRTERGHEVTSCSDVHPGDYVALLYGNENLFVIRGDRQAEGVYRLIGKCALSRSARNQTFLDLETTITLE